MSGSGAGRGDDEVATAATASRRPLLSSASVVESDHAVSKLPGPADEEIDSARNVRHISVSRTSGFGREFWSSKQRIRGINRGTTSMKKLSRESGGSGNKRRGKGSRKTNRLSVAARSSVYAGRMPVPASMGSDGASEKRGFSRRSHQSITARGSLHIEDGVKITQAGIVIHELSQMTVANVHQIMPNLS